MVVETLDSCADVAVCVVFRILAATFVLWCGAVLALLLSCRVSDLLSFEIDRPSRHATRFVVDTCIIASSCLLCARILVLVLGFASVDADEDVRVLSGIVPFAGAA